MNETETIGKFRNKNTLMWHSCFDKIMFQHLAVGEIPSAKLENFATDAWSFNDKVLICELLSISCTYSCR